MRNLRSFLLLIAVMIFAIPNGIAQDYQADDVLGLWLNEDEDAHIEIFKLDNHYFGKLVFILNAIDDETGKAKLDKHNPDESLRSRPTLGIELLTNFEYAGDNKWSDGKIYDPKKGKTYSCYMKFVEEGKLKIRGYIGVSILGKTTYWTKINQ